MIDVLLISEDTLKTFSALPDNVYGKYITPAVIDAQNIYLQKYIGTKLYNKIISDVRSSSVTGYYKTLLDDYIQPYLIYQVITNIIPILGTKIVNLGTVVSNDEHVTNLSGSERDLLDNYYQYRADFYCHQMQEYLLANKNHFPELCTNGCHDIHPTLLTSFETGLYLGGERGGRL